MNRKLALVLSCTIFAAACGNSGESKPADTTASATPPATASAPDPKGLVLIGSSDCTTCHRVHESTSGASIGPAYDQVAAKYSPAADTTVDRLVKKIISGGNGVWGTVPMTPHGGIAQADVKEMVKYILTLKKN